MSEAPESVMADGIVDAAIRLRGPIYINGMPEGVTRDVERQEWIVGGVRAANFAKEGDSVSISDDGRTIVVGKGSTATTFRNGDVEFNASDPEAVASAAWRLKSIGATGVVVDDKDWEDLSGTEQDRVSKNMHGSGLTLATFFDGEVDEEQVAKGKDREREVGKKAWRAFKQSDEYKGMSEKSAEVLTDAAKEVAMDAAVDTATMTVAGGAMGVAAAKAGALAGGALGSVVPGAGNVAGAVIGGAVGALSAAAARYAAKKGIQILQGSASAAVSNVSGGVGVKRTLG